MINAESIFFNCLHDVSFDNAPKPTEECCRCHGLISRVPIFQSLQVSVRGREGGMKEGRKGGRE